MCWPSWNLLNPQSEEFASVASVARGFFYQRNKLAVITAITVTAHSKSITTSKSSLVNETFPKTICFFIFFLRRGRKKSLFLPFHEPPFPSK